MTGLSSALFQQTVISVMKKGGRHNRGVSSRSFPFLKLVALASLVVAAALFAGCARDAGVVDDGVALGRLRPSDVVVSVNGASLTKSALLARVGTMDALRRRRRPNVKVKDETANRLSLCRAYEPLFVEQALLEDWAKRENVAIPPATLKEHERRAFRNLRTKADKSLEDLFNVPGVAADELRGQIRGEALRKAVADALVAKNPTNLPPDFAQRELAGIRAYNAVMAQTNALVHARATNVWNKLKAGADFVATAKTFTEVPEEAEDNGEWGTLDDQFLADDPALLAAIRNLKPGEFTPPMEGDNGLMIAKLDGRTEDGSYELSRIFFRLPLMVEYPTPEEIVATARETHRRNLFDELLKRLKATADVRRPHGQDLFKPPRPPARPAATKEKRK